MSSIDENDNPPGLGLLSKLRENALKGAGKHVDLEDGEINDDESKGLTKATPSELETPPKASEDLLLIKSKDIPAPDKPIFPKVLVQPLNTAQISALSPKHEEMEAETVVEHSKIAKCTMDMQPRM